VTGYWAKGIGQRALGRNSSGGGQRGKNSSPHLPYLPISLVSLVSLPPYLPIPLNPQWLKEN